MPIVYKVVHSQWGIWTSSGCGLTRFFTEEPDGAFKASNWRFPVYKYLFNKLTKRREADERIFAFETVEAASNYIQDLPRYGSLILKCVAPTVYNDPLRKIEEYIDRKGVVFVDELTPIEVIAPVRP